MQAEEERGGEDRPRRAEPCHEATWPRVRGGRPARRAGDRPRSGRENGAKDTRKKHQEHEGRMRDSRTDRQGGGAVPGPGTGKGGGKGAGRGHGGAKERRGGTPGQPHRSEGNVTRRKPGRRKHGGGRGERPQEGRGRHHRSGAGRRRQSGGDRARRPPTGRELPLRRPTPREEHPRAGGSGQRRQAAGRPAAREPARATLPEGRHGG